jgi:hypothetical protein
MRPFVFEYFSTKGDFFIEVQSAHEFSLFQNESPVSIDLLPSRLQKAIKSEIQDRCFMEEACDFWEKQDRAYAQNHQQVQSPGSLR